MSLKPIKKLSEGSDEILELIRSGTVNLLVNTPTKGNDSTRDGFKIRRLAIESSLQIVTSLDTLSAMADIASKDLSVEEVAIYNMGDKRENLQYS